jgi:hypothetical protein
MSVKDRLIILAMWVIAMIVLILIFWDPIDILARARLMEFPLLPQYNLESYRIDRKDP